MSTNDGVLLVDVIESVEGITIRDWFAGMALQGINANPNLDMPASDTANVCYEQADAMLKAREVK